MKGNSKKRELSSFLVYGQDRRSAYPTSAAPQRQVIGSIRNAIDPKTMAPLRGYPLERPIHILRLTKS